MKLNRERKREKEISFTFSFSLLDSFCLVSFLVFIFHFRHANEGISGCRSFFVLLLRSDVPRKKRRTSLALWQHQHCYFVSANTKLWPSIFIAGHPGRFT